MIYCVCAFNHTSSFFSFLFPLRFARLYLFHLFPLGGGGDKNVSSDDEEEEEEESENEK